MIVIKIGIIGCGAIAKLRHALEYAAHPQAQLAGFFNRHKARALEMAEQYGGKTYDSYEELLADPDIDAVSVCTSHSTHAPITIAALKAGKHVLCEKPMATTIADAERMVATARQTGKYLMIAHNQRLDPAHLRAKEILRSGEMGRIISFRTAFSHKGPERWSGDQNSKNWFFDKEAAILGAGGDLGVHKADLIRWLIGDEIQEVMAMVMTLDKKGPDGALIENDDNVMCILRSKMGIAGTLTAGWTNYGLKENGTVLFCSEGVMRLNDHPDYPLEIVKRNGERVIYRFDQGLSYPARTNSGVINHFVNSISADVPPEISGEEGLAALKIIFACMESSVTGKKVQIDN
jgi:predicted dehydrogenase